MLIRVLVVDDSAFIRTQIKSILEADERFSVIGTAGDGQAAVKMAQSLHPDVITMDVAMPVMDGISAVRRIMQQHPVPILMFSSMTTQGASETLDALNAGAIDFLPKKLADLDADREEAKRQLRTRVALVAQQGQRFGKVLARLESPRASRAAAYKRCSPDLLLIAASTGGPVAIQKVLAKVPAACSFPVLLVQHMPQAFTESFAQRLNQQCPIHVKLAQQGDQLQPGLAMLCPGGMQVRLHKRLTRYQLEVGPKRPGDIYAPCADVTFTSVAREMTGKVLAVVLTGMGADGKDGAAALKQRGAEIWAQDELSSTIYGMPKAIVEAGLADHVYDLDEIGNEFSRLV